MEESKAHKIIKWIVLTLAIAINVFLIVNACLPGTQSTQETDVVVKPVIDTINTIKEDTVNETNYVSFTRSFRKIIGHFFLFGVSGFLTTLSFKFFLYDRKQKLAFFIIFSSISGIFFAILTEVIQTFVPGRTGMVTDVLIDLGGYFIGLLIVVLIVVIINIRKNKKEKV